MNARRFQFTLVIVISILISSPLLGQESGKNVRETRNDQSLISVNLFSSLNPILPRYRVGYIKPINEHWRLGVDFGLGLPKVAISNHLPILKNWNEMEDNYILWEVRPEIYYVFNPEQLTQLYISSELFYIHHTDVFHNNFIKTPNRGFFLLESADLRRQKYGMHLKLGIFTNTTDNLGLNFYTGIGFRYRENTYSQIKNPIPWFDQRDMIRIDHLEYEGLDFGWNVSLGVKLIISHAAN